MRVGFFGTTATHMPELLQDHVDFILKGEPEQAAMRIAAGEVPSGTLASPAIDDLDSLPFPAWHLFNSGRHAVGRSMRASRHSFPILSSRSCPEFCTYCPHRITAPYRARSAENVVAEIENICRKYGTAYLIFRDPLFTEERERAIGNCRGNSSAKTSRCVLNAKPALTIWIRTCLIFCTARASTPLPLASNPWTPQR